MYVYSRTVVAVVNTIMMKAVPKIGNFESSCSHSAFASGAVV